VTTSRYDPSHQLSIADADGGTVRYLQRRFLPRVDTRTVADRVVVRAAERADLLAVRTLDDAELAWFLADANDVRRPSELATPGRIVVVPVLRPGAGDAL
jgi:hypothetical protein